MSKPGTIKLNQVSEAYAGFPTYEIDYLLQQNGVSKRIFIHSMTCVDVEFSFKRLNLGSLQHYMYQPGQTLLFEHKNDVLAWCELLNKLIGVESHASYFLPNRIWNEINKYLDDDLKVLVFITRVEI